jgi:hypothetical protein
VSTRAPRAPVEQKPLARPAWDLLWGSVVVITLAVVSGVIAFATTHRPIATAAGIAFEAVLYAGFMWWFSGSRRRREVEDARALVDSEIRDDGAAARSLTLLSPSSPILAGIALGAGAYAIALHRWLVRWEAEHSVKVLRIPAWRRRGVNDYRVIDTASR